MIKWYAVWITIFIIAVVAVIYSPFQARCGASSNRRPIAPSFDQHRAWNDLLYQVQAGYRVPGTKTHIEVRDWLVQSLRASAKTVTLQPFSHKLGGRDVQMWNIIAEIPGTQDDVREKVLLCAHWDSRPSADQDPDPDNRTKPIAAANDGASGVAALLEIARQLKAHPISRDVVIVLFDGEDYGPGLDQMLLGSKYYAEHLPADLPAWGVLLDMIGDKRLDIYREPNSETFAKAVNDRIFAAARELGFVTNGSTPGFVDQLYKYAIIDDHIPLNEKGIPTADLIDFNYPAWHTMQDTPDQCSPESLAIVGKTVLYALRQP